MGVVEFCSGLKARRTVSGTSEEAPRACVVNYVELLLRCADIDFTKVYNVVDVSHVCYLIAGLAIVGPEVTCKAVYNVLFGRASTLAVPVMMFSSTSRSVHPL